MSWDKNTINTSHVDSMIDVLRELEIPHSVQVMAEEHGSGNNDGDEPYKLRRLTYGNFVVLEKFFKTQDCDADDCISSHKFIVDQEPKNWEYVELESPRP